MFLTHPTGRKLRQRFQDKCAVVHTRMRHSQLSTFNACFTVQKHINVDGPLAGITMGVIASQNGAVMLDTPLDQPPF